ncbi:LytR/AlgR family response regulator transcription factor [Larkinella soli]|uniref:LytR/AlgR family response regulator transcription factor n=1 Tax=Larkinella soli TaxID=1770527 RepID=UPI0013E2DF0B|nr:LytTR family DNA-binding domain-containing protein [Larkinella soli]
MKACVIDDEPLAREGLCRLLARHPAVEVAGSYAIGNAAVGQIRQHRPDLLFLDIQMPQLDGFELLDEVIRTIRPVVIFVTAHEEHALRAYQVKAFDYLLKPYTDDDLFQTLERAELYVRGQQALTGLPEPGLSAIPVRTRRGLELIPLDRIDYIRSFDYYACLFSGGRKHLLRQSMNELEEQLGPAGFVRVHRTVLVPLRAIRSLSAQAVVTQDGISLPVSRAGLSRLKAVLER